MKVNVYISQEGKLLHALYRKPDADGRYRTMCGKPCPPDYALRADRVRQTAGLFLDCPACQQCLENLIQKLQEQARDLEQPTPRASSPARDDSTSDASNSPTPGGASRKTRKAGSSGK